jgi:A/G-specific adenine glycosylase
MHFSIRHFQEKLSEWHQENRRDFPWTRTRDPYRIWLSEIILQQTRVNQGLPYYERILSQFPTVQDLAQAEDSVFFKAWEGLGYYSRARNVLHTARWVSKENHGEFPSTYEGLLKLKGIGPYTAAAIAGFAFSHPRAAIDGNGLRVFSRIFDIAEPIEEARVKAAIQSKADMLIYPEDPGAFNQAVMDFGSLVCTPANPECPICPLADICMANRHGTEAQLPVKKVKQPRKRRYFEYDWCERQGKLLVRERREADIWRNLFELPGCERDEATFYGNKQEKPGPEVTAVLFEGKQILSHQEIYVRIRENNNEFDKWAESCIGIELTEVKALPFPKILRSFADSYLEKVFLQ